MVENDAEKVREALQSLVKVSDLRSDGLKALDSILADLAEARRGAHNLSMGMTQLRARIQTLEQENAELRKKWETAVAATVQVGQALAEDEA
jgi:predicted  nucleic acid-binding Zn-ribbon protein